MKKFSVFLEGDSNERQQKKKLTLALIYVTVAIIACLLVTLLVTNIVKVKNPTDGDENGGASAEPAMTTVTIAPEKLHSGSLVLVNKDNEYIFESNPSPVSMSGDKKYTLKDNSLLANATALAAFDKMMDGLYSSVPTANVVVTDAYRSKEAQDALNNGTSGGYSDSHTGMTFTLKHLEIGEEGENIYSPISSVDKYDWLYKNAHKYGFVVRYPANTDAKSFSDITGVKGYDYAFRYVGVAHASYMYQNELCLEEYLDKLQSLDKDTSLSVKASDGRNYEIYYYEASEDTIEIEVPEKVAYEISGDNENGYIVTLNKAKSAKTQ